MVSAQNWIEALGATTPVERELVRECFARSIESGESIFLIMQDAARYWRGAGRLVSPRTWKSRAAAAERLCRRVPAGCFI